MFENLTSGEHGAVFYDAGTGPASILETTFLNCQTTGIGGALYFAGAAVEVDRCCFRCATAAESGSAVAIKWVYSKFDMTGSSFVGCGNSGAQY
jgi:hypothetical protein